MKAISKAIILITKNQSITQLSELFAHEQEEHKHARQTLEELWREEEKAEALRHFGKVAKTTLFH